MAETLAFAAEGKVKADIELQPLSAINKIFDRLEHGKVAGRVVLDFVGAEGREQTDPLKQEIGDSNRRLGATSRG